MWMLCSLDVDAYVMNFVEFAAMETVTSTAVAKLFLGNVIALIALILILVALQAIIV